MHKRMVRRRRAVLTGLVALSLVLLTVYFGEPVSGALHAVQRGAMEVLSPIQEGANRALKPGRDLVNWVGDTLHAKSQRDKLQRERDRLRVELARLQLVEKQTAELQSLHRVDIAGRLSSYKPVTARVITRSPNAWYSTIEINTGTVDGVRRDQPVVSGAGLLVGRVKAVSSHNAVVVLLTDQDFAASVKASRSGEPGTLTPAVGAPGDLLLDLIRHAERLRKGDFIVTAGTRSSHLESLFPAGILVGTVDRLEGDGQVDRRVHVVPAADLRRLDFVQVLTQPQTDLRAALTS